MLLRNYTQTHTHTQTFNGLFSRTTWVGRYQKDKPFWILLKQEMMGWQWHQLNHVQIICTSLQTDNHANTSSIHIFHRPDALPTAQPKASVIPTIYLIQLRKFFSGCAKGCVFSTWYDVTVRLGSRWYLTWRHCSRSGASDFVATFVDLFTSLNCCWSSARRCILYRSCTAAPWPTSRQATSVWPSWQIVTVRMLIF